MNRATAQTQKATAQEEGLAPVLAWVKGLVDDILAEEFGGLSPRAYLKGKSWEEKLRVGREALIKFGVLKP